MPVARTESRTNTPLVRATEVKASSEMLVRCLWLVPLAINSKSPCSNAGAFLLPGLGPAGSSANQIGMTEIRKSLPIALKVGNFAKFRLEYSALTTGTKFLGPGSTYIGAPLSIGLDYHAMNSGEITLPQSLRHGTLRITRTECTLQELHPASVLPGWMPGRRLVG